LTLFLLTFTFTLFVYFHAKRSELHVYVKKSLLIGEEFLTNRCNKRHYVVE